MSLFNRRGSVLITVYVVLGVLLVLSSIFFMRTVSDRKLFDINRERQEAFYLAEAAVDRAVAELKGDWASYTGTASAQRLGRGFYKATVSGSGNQRTILAGGYVEAAPSGAVTSGLGPCNATSGCRAQRTIEAIVRKKESLDGFFDYAIYSAGDVDINGKAYTVDGKVIYADSLSGSTANITGEVKDPDPSIAPLAQLDWTVLRNEAVAQGNLYTSARINDPQFGKPGGDNYPSGFWYSAPTETAPNPEDPGYVGVPNIVYVEGDMVLNGNIGTIGGFFLVVGNVLTDPTGSSSTTINGIGTVDGSIYSTGNFKINGGGGRLNVNGGVWAGLEAELKGNSTIVYNEYFMKAIEHFVNSKSAGSVVQLLSWREV